MERRRVLLAINKSELKANLCDVAYWDGEMVKTISNDKWDISLGAPIGVVVIPSGILSDGLARIVSLQPPGVTGAPTTSNVKMKWSTAATDTSLLNYNKVPSLVDSQSTISSANSAYLPSDKFNSEQSVADTSAYYYNTVNTKAPSPYKNGMLNPDYDVVLVNNNCLSDFDGLGNSIALAEYGTTHTASNAAYKYNDGASSQQWYLPSAGELGFLIARFVAINTVISALGGVSVVIGDLWSSTEIASSAAWGISSVNGAVNTYSKTGTRYVRPFSKLNF